MSELYLNTQYRIWGGFQDGGLGRRCAALDEGNSRGKVEEMHSQGRAGANIAVWILLKEEGHLGGCTMQGLDAQQGVENHTQPPQPGTGREQGENTLQLSMPLVISLKGNFADLTAFKSSLEPQQGWGTCLIQCKKSTFLSPRPPKGCPATAGKRGDSDTSRTVAALCACVTRFYQKAKPACPTDFESTWEGWQGAGHPHRTFHPTVEEYSFFSSMHGSFSRIDQIVGHKASLSKIKKKKKTEITICIFSDHNGTKLEINKLRISRNMQTCGDWTTCSWMTSGS